MEFKFAKNSKIYLGVILLQFGFAGFAIVAKFALNRGTSHYTFAVYRNAIAALVFAPFALIFERKSRPKMTYKILANILVLGFLDPVMGQNLFYAGMNLTTATFTSAMSNILPAIAFVVALILRVEKVNPKKLSSHAKIAGTLVTVGGAMVMTLVTGPMLGLPWTRAQSGTDSSSSHTQDPVKGALMIAAGNVGYAFFYVLQAMTLKSYPAGLTLTTLICGCGALQGTVVTFIIERGNIGIWSIGWNSTLLAYAYGGIISSGVTYYLSGLIMEKKGPVFVTAFNPLNMVIVAVLSSFIFAEQLDLGQVIGAVVIVIGLYLVIWGKSKEYKESGAADAKLPIHHHQQKGTPVHKNQESDDLEANNITAVQVSQTTTDTSLVKQNGFTGQVNVV